MKTAARDLAMNKEWDPSARSAPLVATIATPRLVRRDSGWDRHGIYFPLCAWNYEFQGLKRWDCSH
jgi:hypothetical protein